MVSEQDVIGRLHRADWTKLALSGTVTGADSVVDTVLSVQSDEPLGEPWRRQDYQPPAPPPPPSGLFEHVPAWMFERVTARGAERAQAAGQRSWSFTPGDAGAACSLSVAPGRRFRAESADGTWAVGSDGERLWHWLRECPAGTSVGSVGFGFTWPDDRPRAPYGTLLVPSWLLTGYSLVLDGEVTVGGRAGVRVLGTPRKVAEKRTNAFGGRFGRSASAGGPFAPIPRWLNPPQWSAVEAVVDVELGILLWCSQRAGDEPPSVTEFSSLDVGEPAEASRFSAPAGSVFAGGKGSRPQGPGDQAADGAAGTSLGDALGEALGEALRPAAKEAAQAVAGLAAGGLGALIRYAPTRRRVDPFTRATAETADPEAAMPTDEPVPDVAADEATPVVADEVVPDEVLYLLSRSGLAAPSLRATLHQWTDSDAVLAAIPPSARGAGFGGVGFLIDAVRDSAREGATGDRHTVSTVALGSWKEYRIDLVRSVADGSLFPARSGDKQEALTIASDGVRQWQVYSDRVMTGPAAPPPSELGDLLDASWLLDGYLELSGGTEVRSGGRRAYRIVARYREDPPFGIGWWQRLFFPAVAVVDAETGLVLRLTRFKAGRPTMRQELRDIVPLEPGADFGFTPPDGLRVFGGESQEEDEPKPRSWSWNPLG
jgi:hypothetical protein